MYAEYRGKPRIVACNVAASRRDITRGMALAQARALAGDLLAEPWDSERLARAALGVVTALLAASPRVSWAPDLGDVPPERLPDELGVWWVDAAGLGEESRLARQLLRLARALGFGPARVGIADSAIAAYAATFRRPAGSPPARLTVIVPSGRDAAFLAPYPLGLLALDDDLAGTLAALGLVTVGRLAALQPDEVEARFGPPGLAAHRLARGVDPRGPSTPRDDSLPAAACELGSAVATAEPLLFVMKGALDSLGSTLRARGLAAREVVITLSLDDGSRVERAVRPARPTSHEGALFDHCRAALEDWRLPEPVTAVALRATETVPAAGEQGDLLAIRWADPAALEAAFERIRGKEGGDAVATPEACDGHLPADGGRWTVDRGRTRTRPSRRGSRKPSATVHRPSSTVAPAAALRLLAQPAPVRVRLGREGLEAFREGEIWHDVTAWSGPERITPRWWTGAGRWAPRDYFAARDRAGSLWLLFRARREWFVEGWWD